MRSPTIHINKTWTRTAQDVVVFGAGQQNLAWLFLAMQIGGGPGGGPDLCVPYNICCILLAWFLATGVVPVAVAPMRTDSSVAGVVTLANTLLPGLDTDTAAPWYSSLFSVPTLDTTLAACFAVTPFIPTTTSVHLIPLGVIKSTHGCVVRRKSTGGSGVCVVAGSGTKHGWSTAAG